VATLLFQIRRQSDRQRKENDDHENRADDEGLFGRSSSDHARRLAYRAGNGRCLGELRRVCGEHSIHRRYAFVDFTQSLFQDFPLGVDGIHVEESGREIAARALQLLQLVGQLALLRAKSFVDLAGSRRTSAPENDGGAHGLRRLNGDILGLVDHSYLSSDTRECEGESRREQR